MFRSFRGRRLNPSRLSSGLHPITWTQRGRPANSARKNRPRKRHLRHPVSGLLAEERNLLPGSGGHPDALRRQETGGQGGQDRQVRLERRRNFNGRSGAIRREISRFHFQRHRMSFVSFDRPHLHFQSDPAPTQQSSHIDPSKKSSFIKLCTYSLLFCPNASFTLAF